MEKVFSVMGHLSEWLKRPRLGDSKPPTLWPSSAGATDKTGKYHGSCRRASFLQYLMPLVKYSDKVDGRYLFWKDLVKEAAEKLVPFDKYQLWLFDNADRYEQYMIEHSKESGIYIADQIVIYLPKYNLSGKIDLIILNPYTGKYIISEVKSVYGYGADEVLGKNFDRHRNFTGEPRVKNLMQIAIYQWHYATAEKFENGRLLYGDRGTGKYAEYEIAVDKESGVIRYRCIDPVVSNWREAPYTVLDILTYYKALLDAADQGVFPEPDFSIKYSIETLNELVNEQYIVVEIDKEEEEIARFDTVEKFIAAADGKKGRKFYLEEKESAKLSKATAEQYVKYKDRIINGGRQVKAPADGDYQCHFCQFKNYCWNENGEKRK